MEEKVVDRRVRKTKRQLRLALMKLMSEKSVKDISVRELAAIADINRGTFYIHYKDVYDLLSSLEDELADGLTVVDPLAASANASVIRAVERHLG